VRANTRARFVGVLTTGAMGRPDFRRTFEGITTNVSYASSSKGVQLKAVGPCSYLAAAEADVGTSWSRNESGDVKAGETQKLNLL
jgi:hypothetical protein